MFRHHGTYLSADEAMELTEQLVQVSESNLPFSDGLRAAATDISNHRVRTGLNQLAECVEYGQTLDEGLDARDLRIPSYLSGLLKAGARSGRLPNVLADLADHYRASRDLYRQVWSVLTYPIFLLILLGIVLGIVLFWVMPDMIQIYRDFDVEVSRFTQSMIWMSEVGWKYLFGGVVGAVALFLLIRIVGGRVRWMQFVSTVPGFGDILHWQGFAEFAELLRLLLVQEVPLVEALQLTAGAIRNPNVAHTTKALAVRVESGVALADAMLQEDQVPPHLIPVVRIGEQNDQLSESLSVIYELLEGQIRLRSRLMVAVLPPVMFLVIAGFAIALLFGLFVPLVNLISYLTF